MGDLLDCLAEMLDHLDALLLGLEPTLLFQGQLG